MTASDMLNIAGKHIKQLQINLQPLTEIGKLEALIYGSLICNFSAQSKLTPQQVSEINQDLFAILIDEFRLHIDETDTDKIGELIESRFQIHYKDIIMILDGGAQFDPVNSYFYFYEAPLSKQKPVIDAAVDMNKFKSELVQMTNQILQEADDF